MRQSFLIYEEMRKYFPIYEEAVCNIWLCNCCILNFLIYEENLIFFFISVHVNLVMFCHSLPIWFIPNGLLIPSFCLKSPPYIHVPPPLWHVPQYIRRWCDLPCDLTISPPQTNGQWLTCIVKRWAGERCFHHRGILDQKSVSPIVNIYRTRFLRFFSRLPCLTSKP